MTGGISRVKVMREVAWLVFDEIHYMRDPGESVRLVYYTHHCPFPAYMSSLYFLVIIWYALAQGFHNSSDVCTSY